MIFKYSKRDSLLVLICLLNFTGFLVLASFFDQVGIGLKLLLGLGFVGLYCTNYQCVSHNFIHNHFFNSPKLNFYFSLLNSMTMGLPQMLYYQHHMNHHRFNNDKVEEGHTTKDISSLYRYGKNGEVENILSYSFIGFFRIDLVHLAKRNKGKNWSLFKTELLFVAIFWTILMMINYKFFFTFYLP